MSRATTAARSPDPDAAGPRHWTMPPEEVRRLDGPVASSWTEDQLYAADQLMNRIASRDVAEVRDGREE